MNLKHIESTYWCYNTNTNTVKIISYGVKSTPFFFSGCYNMANTENSVDTRLNNGS